MRKNYKFDCGLLLGFTDLGTRVAVPLLAIFDGTEKMSAC
jgi:hypothetical protein